MARKRKDDELKARVSRPMKTAVKKYAASRGEGESLIFREAVLEYLEKRGIKVEHNK